MNSISDILSDYNNLTPISGDTERTCFEAIQAGTGRTVILEVLKKKEPSGEQATSFLEGAKIKASVDCPHVCSILEAGEREGILFMSREKPTGKNLRQLRDEGKSFSSDDILNVLSIVSDAFIYFDQQGINTSPADIDHIYMGDHGISLANPAIPGIRKAETALADMQTLGSQLASLTPDGAPGSTRLKTICRIMNEGHMGTLVDWPQIKEMTQTVLEQLGQNKGSSTKMVVPKPSAKRFNWVKTTCGFAGAALLAAAGIFFFLNKEAPVPPPTPRHKIPAFLNRDHTLFPVSFASTSSPASQVLCDAHEVTIGAYSRFLDSLDNMPASARNNFDEPNQPARKNGHIPNDWNNMIKAAKTNSLWQGKKISMRHPIVNVDFWDASAYARWKDHRLPTREEWMSIAGNLQLNGKVDKPCPVDQYHDDVDASGLCGFASGVKEWTSSIDRDISRPTDPPKRISCGGTSSHPGLQQSHYESSSEERSSDLGFRTIRN